MIQTRLQISGQVNAREKLSGQLNSTIKYISPELEDLEVTPSAEEQTFKSEKYGYATVTVKRVETEELNVKPSLEEQEFEGLYGKVNVEPYVINTENITITPTSEQQIFTSEKDGYKTVIVEKQVGYDTSNATIEASDVALGKTAYGVNGEIIGTSENNVTMNTTFPLGINKNNLYKQIVKMSVINAENMTSLDHLFNDMPLLEEITEIINSENVVTAQYTFYNCTNLKKVPDISDLSNVEGIPYMFYGCSNLTTISLNNLKKLTNLAYAFDYCTNLKELYLSDLNTTIYTSNWFKSRPVSFEKIVMTGLYNVTNANSMFWECTNLKSATLTDLNKLEDIEGMFAYCSNLETIDLSGLNNIKIINSAFYYCQKLTSMPVINASKIIHVGWSFTRCYALKDVGGFIDLGKAYTEQIANNYVYGLRLNPSTQLTHASLMNVINGLYDLNLTYNVANGGTLYTQDLVLGPENLAKLTAKEIAIATSKGWSVS